ncbi:MULTISPECIES: hypothetical protein [unclassified Dehalobacter]|uniref:hypothetical protein n=1 Tax=unclassified Dehalobacter TaxID=2635733 RepID=UPI00028B8D0E|nr:MULTISPECIES: hypothetical protein [unclassified Dehalobacter]AFV01101.1 hypothetical protein DHBDCA_p73 [Dehalobacter sp. DCA]AFV04141.1 hypothetical protein DCF50_p135 [Dehalobacter sp. CF]
MAQFTVDLKGRINNTFLPESKSLWPLFEAVVNSIQSLEDSETVSNKLIRVFAQRQETSQYDINGKIEVTPFEAFSITDNGNGFTSDNYQSFRTADSSLKWKKGCKGIGRFLWLKAFEKVEISSTFFEDGKWRDRLFSFDFNGTTPDDNIQDSASNEYQTTVTLEGFKRNFREKCPISLEVLAKKIIEHCLVYFLFDDCPKIVVQDSLGEQFWLNDYFDRFIRDSLHQDRFNIAERSFTLYHIKMPEGANAHELHLCANKREVKSYQLNKYLPNLQGRIYDETGKSFHYAGFLSSSYLDGAVNSSRTNFDFEKNGQIDIEQNLPEKELIDAANNYIVTYLNDYLDEIIKQKEKRINDYVTHRQPKYRYLVAQRPTTYDAIAPNISDKELDIALYKELLQWDLETKKTGEQLQEDLSKNLLSASDVKARYDEYYKQINGLSKTSLAEYIVRRKVILDLLENALQITPDGKYASEESVHSIICPMRYTSDEISFEEMNLWIINERLAYHNFLASDKQMKSIPVIDSESDDRMDIAIFDEAISFSDKDNSFNSITIIEFKKPNRNDLKPDDKNPIHQVLRYVEEIKNGKKMRANGRPFGNVSNTAFYCYVIADMTDSLKEDAKFAGLRITPDGEGYFGYNPDPGAYIEVISFDKLIRDANERNRILFDKLFTPSARTILDHNI